MVEIKRVIECCVCGMRDVEPQVGAGFVGWGSLGGIILNGEPNPDLCPEHLNELAFTLDVMAKNPIHLKNKGVM